MKASSGPPFSCGLTLSGEISINSLQIAFPQTINKQDTDMPDNKFLFETLFQPILAPNHYKKYYGKIIIKRTHLDRYLEPFEMGRSSFLKAGIPKKKC